MAQIGGSFAPPLTAPTMAVYRALLGAAAPGVKTAALQLADMVDFFNLTPRSKLAGYKHASGLGTVVKLDFAEVERIKNRVPDRQEIVRLSGVFNALPAGATRDAAFHLLWYAVELWNGREPITTDKL